MKGFKVTNKNRSKMVGVACTSLKELLSKGCEKLNIAEEPVATLDDGTIIDDEDYFQALPAQSVIVLYRRHEDILTGVDFVLRMLRQVNNSYLETGSKAREVVLGQIEKLMRTLKGNDKSDTWKNTREEDPDWFLELETNAHSKDDYMHRKSQDRIRGYFYKFQEDVRRSLIYKKNSKCRKIIQDCLTFFKNRLKSDGYFGCYFDRRCAYVTDGLQTHPLPGKRSRILKPVPYSERGSQTSQAYDKFSFCDHSGNFVCQGKWKMEGCDFAQDHQINPYENRQSRIVFSTWNLDHRIERSRSVVPTLLEVIETCEEFRAVNFLYFYLLLFTKMNLKLVHVVCHDKSTHDISCDSSLYYI